MGLQSLNRRYSVEQKGRGREDRELQLLFEWINQQHRSIEAREVGTRHRPASCNINNTDHRPILKSSEDNDIALAIRNCIAEYNIPLENDTLKMPQRLCIVQRQTVSVNCADVALAHSQLVGFEGKSQDALLVGLAEEVDEEVVVRG